jgi:hypothetical protein
MGMIEIELIEWQEWGTDGTRLVNFGAAFDLTWICHINGAKFVSLNKTDSTFSLQVYHINQLKPSLPPWHNAETSASGNYYTDECAMGGGEIFRESILTNFPCDIRQRDLSDLQLDAGSNHTAICTEDAILVVCSKKKLDITELIEPFHLRWIRTVGHSEYSPSRLSVTCAIDL